MDKYKFGDFIYNKRKSLGLTQDELGRKLGVTNKAVSKWETGETLPDIQILEMLAGALNVTIDELLTQKAPEVEVKYIEPKKTLFKPIAFILGAIMLIVIISLSIALLPKDEHINKYNAHHYYSIDVCKKVSVDKDKITISGNAYEKRDIIDTNIKLSLTVQYLYKNTDGVIAEILYLDRIVELSEDNMSFELTLAPKNEIQNFESFYSFDVSYEIIEVSGNVS